MHLLPADVPRGAQTYARQLRDALDDSRMRHQTVTLFGRRGATVHADVALETPDGALRRLGVDPRAVWRLRRTLRRLRPSAVVAHGGEPLQYAVLAGVPRDRLVYLKIGAADVRLTRFKRGLHRRLLRRVRAAVVVSKFAQAEAIALGVPRERVTVIPNGRDPSDYTVHAVDGSHTPKLVFVGHLDASKRPLRFLDVIDELHRDDVPCAAVIAGDGPLFDVVRSRGEELGAEVRGAVADVPALLAESDALLFTGSPPEGMPGVLIEAGMSGLPVVTTAVPGADEVVADGETGFVVPVDDFDALARATRTIAGDGALRARLGAAARARCEQHFNIRDALADWRELLRPIVDEACASST
ncbi:MAG TPA: glycosyltransferase family 4 protein [Acidimicrobiia bacterium]|nr:glycosyltransferase family 4 protein [Acidimicrobiia bacterium]